MDFKNQQIFGILASLFQYHIFKDFIIKQDLIIIMGKKQLLGKQQQKFGNQSQRLKIQKRAVKSQNKPQITLGLSLRKKSTNPVKGNKMASRESKSIQIQKDIKSQKIPQKQFNMNERGSCSGENFQFDFEGDNRQNEMGNDGTNEKVRAEIQSTQNDNKLLKVCKDYFKMAQILEEIDILILKRFRDPLISAVASQVHLPKDDQQGAIGEEQQAERFEEDQSKQDHLKNNYISDQSQIDLNLMQLFSNIEKLEPDDFLKILLMKNKISMLRPVVFQTLQGRVPSQFRKSQEQKENLEQRSLEQDQEQNSIKVSQENSQKMEQRERFKQTLSKQDEEEQNQQEKSQKKQQYHVCHICWDFFQNGHQLGGHMSKKHPGQSIEYLNKQRIRDRKNIQRHRRRYFKMLKRKVQIKKKKQVSMQSQKQSARME